jgi:hypothetical protein
MIVVVSSGTSDQPIYHGDGGIDVELRMATAVLVSGPESTVARRLAGHYQAALVDLLLKKKTWTVLGSTTAKINQWLGVALDDIDDTVERTLASARLEFAVEVRDFANRNGGPETVPVDPLVPQPDYPTVQTQGTTTGPLP